MNFYNEVKEIIHSEYDWDDISSGKIAEAITDIHNKEVKDLKTEIVDHKGLLRTYATENIDLKSQLANIKYLNADEVEKILEIMQDDARAERLGYFKRTVNAICNLAIPDIDRDKINQELLDQLYRFEGVMGKYDCQHGGMECNFQTAFHRLIRAEIDEIIKAIRGEE